MEIQKKNYDGQVKGSSNRNFGFVFFLFFTLIGIFPKFRSEQVRVWAITLAIFFGASAILAPKLLAPLNKLWARIGQILHDFVSPIALGLIFYLTVLPTGFLLRLFGKDPLKLRIDRTASSYWVQREPQSPSAESLNNQF